MRFAMFSDLHYDAIPDGNTRVKEIITYAKKAKADFIIDIGDLCCPINGNRIVLETLKNSELPCYFTVGNHNTDNFTIDEVINFFNLERSYYSFIKENIKFIILDANFINKKTTVIPYCKRNYDKSNDEYPYIPNIQIEWLKKELADDDMNVSIEGIKGNYQKHSPKDVGLTNYK